MAPWTQPKREELADLTVLYQGGRLEEALTLASRLAAKYPFSPLFPNVRGTILARSGRSREALAALTEALRHKPDYDDAHNNLGNVLMEIGRHEEAISCYRRAIDINPGFEAAHNNLGNALNELGRHDEAVPSLTRALELDPGYAVAHNNLGIAYLGLRRHDEAIASLTRALQLRPAYAGAHNNLGNTFRSLGLYKEAIASYTRALQIDPNNTIYWQNLADVLIKFSFDAYSEELEHAFLRILEQRTLVNPSNAARAIISLLKQRPLMREVLQLFSCSDIRRSAPELCAGLSNIPLFLRLLELCPIPDREFESLLTELRKALLLNIDQLPDGQASLEFQISLALHCFTNEYVFYETAEELRAVDALQAEIAGALADAKEIAPAKIAGLACYRPLHGYAWAHEIKPAACLHEVFRRQVADIEEERAIRAAIPRLKEIDDPTSVSVRAQYEEHPYPRWVNTQLISKPVNIATFASQLELNITGDTRSFAAAPEILVAGCGTGRHSISTASRFSNSRVLAVDLSLSSLSYAIRKTRELGITTIEYMQADILDLAALDRQFDIVESSGVLHHMADPMAGWRAITRLLRPGGLMKIGLYSDPARRAVVEAREVISSMGLSATPEDIRQFRHTVLTMDTAGTLLLWQLMYLNDFFSMSECRDLVFHAQEQRFTLLQIKEALVVLGLVFLGFELENTAAIRSFRIRYPNHGDIYSLDLWHEFETENPGTFIGMYQFWVQKAR